MSFSEASIRNIMNSAVSKATEELTDLELNSLAVSLMLGTDPRHIAGYDKVRHLYTNDQSGMRMHEETKHAFLVVHSQRLA